MENFAINNTKLPPQWRLQPKNVEKVSSWLIIPYTVIKSLNKDSIIVKIEKSHTFM